MGFLPMDRRKQLKEEYKQLRPDMGIFIIRSNFGNKCFLEATNNLKGKMNGTIFQLKFGSHINKELQKDWNEHRSDSFTIEILEKLEYDKDESKKDYSDELEILKAIWEEKLMKEDIEFY